MSAEQLTLDAYRNSDPETSRLAAAKAEINASTNRERVHALLGAYPEGLTDFELVEEYAKFFPGTRPQQTSLGKRRGELRDLGLVEAVTVEGRTVKRPAPSGSLAIVWRAVQS